MADLDRILREALGLSPEDREKLLATLEASLDSTLTDLDDDERADIQRRLDAALSGGEGLDAEQVLLELEQKYRG